MTPRRPPSEQTRFPESSYQEIADAILAEADRIPADVLRELLAKRERSA